MSPRAILLIIAVICFVAAALGINLNGINLSAIGLAAFAGSFLVGEGGIRLR